MRGFACLALDVGVGFETADFADVVLEARAVLAQIVPQPGEMRPVMCTEWSGMFSSQCRHALQVVGEIMGGAPTSIRILGGVGDRL